jgi:hypothetical protein
MRYKDSITYDAAEIDDSNPEGINQYTGGGGGSSSSAKAASASAEKASKQMSSSPGVRSAKALEKAHRTAAAAHMKAYQASTPGSAAEREHKAAFKSHVESANGASRAREKFAKTNTL